MSSTPPDLVLSWLEKVDMPDAWFRRFACWCVRHTPLRDGRTVWDLLTDERSRNAVKVAERFADGQATKEELKAARESARAAARDAAREAARDAARAAWDAAREAARQAQADHLLADEEFVLTVGRASLLS